MKRQTTTITRVFPNDLELLKQFQKYLKTLYPNERMNSADVLHIILKNFDESWSKDASTDSE